MEKEKEKNMPKEATSGAKVMILGHKCYRCGHEWRPVNFDEIPKVCPKCKSPYWDVPRKDKVAKK